MPSIDTKYQLTFAEFERFFRENYRAASLIGFRYISDHSLVEDIVQESFVILWERRSEIVKTKDDLRKYLLVTVRNHAISYLRSVKVKSVNIEALLSEIKQSESEKLYDEEELSIRIEKAIEKLPVKCREIFLLAYVENLTYNAIAQQLSISKNTVKTQMAVAYRILRRELKELYFGFLLLMAAKCRD